MVTDEGGFVDFKKEIPHLPASNSVSNIRAKSEQASFKCDKQECQGMMSEAEINEDTGEQLRLDDRCW